MSESKPYPNPKTALVLRELGIELSHEDLQRVVDAAGEDRSDAYYAELDAKEEELKFTQRFFIRQGVDGTEYIEIPEDEVLTYLDGPEPEEEVDPTAFDNIPPTSDDK